MTKPLALLAIFAILVLGVIGALAVIPHTHGNDVNHSKHQSCPVYQFSLHSSSAFVTSFYVISAALFVVCLVFITKQDFTADFFYRLSSPRAPPALV